MENGRNASQTEYILFDSTKPYYCQSDNVIVPLQVGLVSSIFMNIQHFSYYGFAGCSCIWKTNGLLGAGINSTLQHVVQLILEVTRSDKATFQL